MIISQFIHIAANDFISFFFMTEYYSYFFIHSSVSGHLGRFRVLAITKSVSMNIAVYVSFQIMVFSRYIPRSGTAGSYGSFSFHFLRYLHT